jgi:1-hydroxycarotenoid 3,4-desaturase
MPRVIIIGAGAGGLAAALALAAAGWETTVLERAAGPGGKMRATESPLGPVDAGPTVFTMRFVFEELFAAAGLAFEDFVRVQPLGVLARHAWTHSDAFDLPADPQAAIAAVDAFAGPANAAGFKRFLAEAAGAYRTLLGPFMTAQRPTPMGLASRIGLRGLPGLLAARPFARLWAALGDYFPDPRLRQLFARYATYTGASPFEAPATLMLIAHVEQAGVWSVAGGMRALALGLAEAAGGCGARFRYHTHAREILVRHGEVCGVATEDGERFMADAVIVNADIAALAAGAFGQAAKHAVGPHHRAPRSLSALTWTGAAKVKGFDLMRHNVFFSDDYADEFRRIFKSAAAPADPTVYVCAQDRDDTAAAPDTGERLLVLVNAPPRADDAPLSQEDIDRCHAATFSRLIRAGLSIRPIAPMEQTRPQDFHRLFPHTGGAIYGPANHGPFAAFSRQSARTKLPGLYVAGGSVHPSAGAPMATLSGMLAAQALRADRPSTRPFFRAVTSGGTSTPSATTAATD